MTQDPLKKDGPRGPSFWNNPARRGLVYQAGVLIAIGLLACFLIGNTLANVKRQSIATGFGFLQKEAAFEIGETLIPYSAADRYLRALTVGLLNTLLVSGIGVVLTVLLGTLIGIARLSRNWLVARLSALYIEVFQDIPVLLQLFFWYAFFTEILPSPRQALHPFSGVFLSNRGLVFGVPAPHPCHGWMIAALATGFGAALLLRRWAKLRQARSGKALPVLRMAMALVGAGPLAVWLLAGAPRGMILPELAGFNFRGGISVSPEFSALLLGLVLYTAAFVAEIVRAGIQAVSRGQSEAALSLGLKTGQTLHLVILPQALRVIIPPLTSQMLNLTKNSSLAVAIGYPDFVSVAGTAINQTGQAIEGVALIMSAYLFLSLLTSAFMNWYNRKMALVER